MSDGTHYLRVARINDIVKMISSMRLVVKHRQAQAMSDYFMGKLTGNQLLLILHQEYLAGRRRSEIPSWALTKFPLTRLEAKALGHRNGALAGAATNRAAAHERAIRALPALPSVFYTNDLMRILSVSRPAAIGRGRYLERLGLVTTCRIAHGGGRPMIQFAKV
jgi:hypothetical protein